MVRRDTLVAGRRLHAAPTIGFELVADRGDLCQQFGIWCDAVRCGQRIFAERFADSALAPMGEANRLQRGLVRRIVRGERNDVFRVRESTLEGHLPLVEDQWAAGCRNGAELWRRLKSKGFRGSLRVVTEWATRRRRAECVDAESLYRIPSARTIARLLPTARDTLSKAETVTVAAVEAGIPSLIDTRTLIGRFRTMIRRKSEADLPTWI